MTTKASKEPTGAPAAPLVEREREIATLAGVLDEAAAGSGAVALVTGGPGTGKTRLLAETASLSAAREMRILRARGAELEREFAFGLIRQLLEAEARRIASSESGELPAAIPAIAMLEGAPPAEPPPQDAMFAVVHGVYWLCARLAEERPTALLVDDVHWGDASSLRALEYLANRLAELSVVLVLALRADELPPQAEWIRGAADRTHIATGELTEDGSARLLAHLLGSIHPDFASSAYGATGGNPLLLREVALATTAREIEPDAGGADEIASLAPGSVADWALERLERYDEDDRRLAQSLAVLEEPAVAVAAAHAELSDARTRAAADRLVANGLLDDSLPLRFAHPIVRRALYSRLPPAARDRDHRRAARLLSDAGARPEQVASHLFACEPRGDRWATQALRAHAAIAASRGASVEAARSLQRAIAERSDEAVGELLLELGLVELAGNDPAAIDHLAVAIREAGTPETRAAAEGGLAYARYLSGDTLGAFDAARAGLEEIRGSHQDALEAALLVCSLIAGRAHPRLVSEVRDRLGEPPSAGELSAPAVVSCQVRALDDFLRGHRDSAARNAARAAEAMLDPATLDAVPAILTPGPAFVLAGIGRYSDAEPLVESALLRASRRGSRLETGQALYDRIWMRWRIGELNAGLADCEQLFSLAEGAWELAKTPARVAAASMLIECGELDRAAEQLSLPDEVGAVLEGTWGWSWIPYGRAELALARGDAAGARAFAEEAGARLAALQATSPEYCAWRSLASRAAIAAGDHARAVALAEEELAVGRAAGSDRAIGVSLAALGSALGGQDGEAAFAEADEHLAAAGARLERARATVSRGMALRRSRRARDARDPLREGGDLAAELGATRLAQLAIDELRAAGGKPRRLRSTGSAALTARERQVAELAASGLGNREIAQRLFITRKTVEAHLRAVFRKLDVSAREQLPAAIGARPERR